MSAAKPRREKRWQRASERHTKKQSSSGWDAWMVPMHAKQRTSPGYLVLPTPQPPLLFLSLTLVHPSESLCTRTRVVVSSEQCKAMARCSVGFCTRQDVQRAFATATGTGTHHLETRKRRLLSALPNFGANPRRHASRIRTCQAGTRLLCRAGSQGCVRASCVITNSPPGGKALDGSNGRSER